MLCFILLFVVGAAQVGPLEFRAEGPENNPLGYQKILLEGPMDPNIQDICNKFLYGDIPKFACKIHDSHVVYCPNRPVSQIRAPSGGLSRTSGKLWQDYSNCYMFWT